MLTCLTKIGWTPFSLLYTQLTDFPLPNPTINPLMRSCTNCLLIINNSMSFIAYAIPFCALYVPHKLEYRSKPCIFLGYQFVGYKCLDLVTNKVYLSRHVVFDEAVFLAKDHATSLLPS
jgi:hypothetical protein